MTGKGGSDGGRAARFLPPQGRRKGAHEERPYTRQRASFPLSRESRSEGCRRCDTRPYRSRPRDRYAGCMTGVRTAAIGPVYSSGPSYRSGLWIGRRNFVFDGTLAPLVAESRPRPWKRHGLRMPRVPDRWSGLLVDRRLRVPESGAVGILGREASASRPGFQPPLELRRHRAARFALRKGEA